jgi:hypothetical protein
MQKKRALALTVLALLLLLFTGSCGIALFTDQLAGPTDTPVGPTDLPTVDANDAIRAEQAIRNIVIPNLTTKANATNTYIGQLCLSLGYAQLWYVRYDLVEWQSKSVSPGQYQVHVRFKLSEACQSSSSVCSEQKQLALSSGALNAFGACVSPAEFLVLLDEPMTVVPKNACAEAIYY